MKTLLLVLCICGPNLLFGATTILVDAIPTAGVFAGVTPIRLPFKDAASAATENIETGLNQAVAGILSVADQQGFSFICLLSAPGDNPIEIPIHAAKANLKLSRENTMIYALFYREGHQGRNSVTYRTGTPEPKTAHVSAAFRLIAVPEGGSIAGWIYLNLPRIQEEAEKAKSSTVFLETSGTGSVTAVVIPGMKNPILVHEEKAVFTGTWYLGTDAQPGHETEFMGHKIVPDTQSAPAASK